MKTIRRQLLIGLLGGALACTVFAGVAMYRKVLEEANELFDYQLRQLALSLPSPGALPLPARAHGDPEEDMMVQIWDRNGKLVYSSDRARSLPRASGMGYASVQAGDQRWRAYSASRDGGQVQVAQALLDREELAAGLAFRSLLPFLLMIPVLGVLIYVVVGNSLQPLARLAHAVGRRSPTALQPLPPDGHPPELVPVVVALNELLQQLDHALASQRAFVADAAHELRSPLTALKLQLQLAERAGSDEQRSQAFGKLHERLSRATHLVSQLLASARQEAGAALPASEPVDLLELAQHCVGDLYVHASAKGIDLGVSNLAEQACVAGSFGSLQVMLGNLIDNAVRYTPRDGRVDVSVRTEDGQPVIEVVDTGPGIPVAERSRVFDRFYRGETNDGWGSGLGLSIVSSVAAAHKAQVTLDDGPDGRGLRVSVRFARESGRGEHEGIPVRIAELGKRTPRL
jgi:two-component system OmpR family sensor kinase